MRLPPVIILDTEPLGDSVIPPADPEDEPTRSQQCRQWLTDCEQAGVLLMAPAICYYEALRELERRRATGKITRLKRFVFLTPGRFLPLSTAHLESAAKLWGQVRRGGMPTAAPAALDGDVILAAQALGLGLSASEYVVATSNPRHLSRFVPCEEWTNLKP